MIKAKIITYRNWNFKIGGLMYCIESTFRIGFILFLLYALSIQSLNAQSKSASYSNSPKYKTGDIRLLNSPKSDGPTVVHVSFHLQDIDEINDQLEVFHLVGFINLKWIDPRESFDPDKTGVLEKVYQGSYQFNELAPSWYPQIEVVNISGVLDRQSIILRVKPDGTCLLTQSVNVLVKSRLHLWRYPFDSQDLEVAFKVQGYNNKEVVLTTDSNSISGEYNRNRIPQWNLTGINGSVEDVNTPYSNGNDLSSSVVFTFSVERESFFIVRLIVIPLTLIVLLSWSVFWMGQSSLGDRMSVSFVGILTAVTYQVLVAGILPQISGFTLMHSFLGINFIIMCLTVLINLVVGYYDRVGNEETGDKVDRFCRWAFPGGYVTLNIAQLAFFY